MRVSATQIWTKGSHTQADALTWAGVASNPANKEEKFIGFNPTTKRTVVYCEHPQRGKMKISKGLTSKVLCTGEDGGDCWEVEDLAQIKEEVQQVDVNFSLQGYKTLGVAIA